MVRETDLFEIPETGGGDNIGLTAEYGGYILFVRSSTVTPYVPGKAKHPCHVNIPSLWDDVAHCRTDCEI